MSGVEDIIKQITKIDQAVYLKKVSSEEDLKQAQSDLNKKAQALTETIISEAEKDVEQKYKQEIKEQIDAIKQEEIKTHKTIQQIKLRYNQIEEKTCEKLVERIFSLEE